MTEDKTGEPPTTQDVRDAIEAVTKRLHSPNLLALPPDLVVQLPNVLRCLKLALRVTTMSDAFKKRLEDDEPLLPSWKEKTDE